MRFDFSLIRENPVASGAIIIGGGLAVYFLLLRPATDTGSAAAPAPAFNAAQASYDLQARTIQAEITKEGLRAQTQIALADRSADLQRFLTQDTNAARLAEVRTAADVSIRQITTNAEIARSEIGARLEANRQATDVQQATIQAGMVQFLAGTQAQLELGKAQTAATVQMSQINADVQRAQIDATARIAAMQQRSNRFGSLLSFASALF